MLQSLTDQLVTTGVSNPDRHYPLPRLDNSATEGRFWRSPHLVGESGSKLINLLWPYYYYYYYY